MNLHIRFQTALMNEMRVFLEQHFVTLGASPTYLTDEIQKIAGHIKKSKDCAHLRNYLLSYIGLTSGFWRAITPYTYHNKLLTLLESVVNAPEFSPQSIHIAQISGLHEHYLAKQKELVEPLQIEIQTLQTTCEKLQTTVTTLREENTRLRLENDFFMKEIVILHSKFSDPSCASAARDNAITKDPAEGSVQEHHDESFKHNLAPV